VIKERSSETGRRRHGSRKNRDEAEDILVQRI
jgi:hypothetical protein